MDSEKDVGLDVHQATIVVALPKQLHATLKLKRPNARVYGKSQNAGACNVHCPKISFLLVTFLLLIGSVIAQEPPDWAKRDYSAPADQVFAAALKSIQEQHHEVKSKDDGNRTVDFHVGTTAWSWGYNMRLTVTPIDEAHARAVVGIMAILGQLGAESFGRRVSKTQDLLIGHRQNKAVLGTWAAHFSERNAAGLDAPTDEVYAAAAADWLRWTVAPTKQGL